VVGCRDVQQAIDTISTAGSLRDRLYERFSVVLDDSHEECGGTGQRPYRDRDGRFVFAQPTRITATTRLGEGFMNIDREVELSGPFIPKAC